MCQSLTCARLSQAWRGAPDHPLHTHTAVHTHPYISLSLGNVLGGGALSTKNYCYYYVVPAWHAVNYPTPLCGRRIAGKRGRRRDVETARSQDGRYGRGTGRPHTGLHRHTQDPQQERISFRSANIERQPWRGSRAWIELPAPHSALCSG